MPSSFSDIDHLLRRSSFGASRDNVNSLAALNWADAVDVVLDQTPVPPHTQSLPDLSDNRSYWEKYVGMTRFWIERARTIQYPLAEKMVLFWSGVLCTGLRKVNDHQLLFDQNQLFRTAGLGNFRTLLQATSVQPAMLKYLDNELNRVGRPNENFARELMELFTLGVGNYSEDDVRESARAWTGYGVDDNNNFVFSPDEHDNGSKTFFGTTKNWNGPEIIDHLLDGPKRNLVAQFIARKLFSFFGHPNPSAAVVNDLAAVFLASNWDIAALVRAIFLHAEFRSPASKNGLLRSPFELVVAALRHSGLSGEEVNSEWQLMTMGQEMYNPPNVAGWKQNEYWLTSSSTWAKIEFASSVRWKSYNLGTFSTIRDLQPVDAARLALEHYGVYDPTARTLATIRKLVEAERAAVPNSSWTERSALLFVPLTTPEFQLA